MDHTLHFMLIVAALAAFFVVPPSVAIPILVVTGGAVLATSLAINRARRLPVRTGNESIIEGVATVIEWERPTGLVRHRGELWRATGTSTFKPRETARIVRAEDTLLHVRP
jgi:membrane protein implicated in regulation of membrane protease activity